MTLGTLVVERTGYLSIPAELIDAAGLNTRPRELIGCAPMQDQLLIAPLRALQRDGSLALVMGTLVRKDGTLKVPPEALRPLGLAPGQDVAYALEQGLIRLLAQAERRVSGR